MSYCRWSSDNWRCDVYAFADSGGGFTTHVAGNRVVGDIPLEPTLDEEINDEWMKRHQAVMDFLKTAERKPIGLASDGETFHDSTLSGFLERMTDLRGEGYNIPDYVFDEIREEMSQPPPETAEP